MASEYDKYIKKQKQVRLSPWLYRYHACEHITRKSRADSRMRWFHARIKEAAGVHEVCVLTEEKA